MSRQAGSACGHTRPIGAWSTDLFTVRGGNGTKDRSSPIGGFAYVRPSGTLICRLASHAIQRLPCEHKLKLDAWCRA